MDRGLPGGPCIDHLNSQDDDGSRPSQADRLDGKQESKRVLAENVGEASPASAKDADDSIAMISKGMRQHDPTLPDDSTTHVTHQELHAECSRLQEDILGLSKAVDELVTPRDTGTGVEGRSFLSRKNYVQKIRSEFQAKPELLRSLDRSCFNAIMESVELELIVGTHASPKATADINKPNSRLSTRLLVGTTADCGSTFGRNCAPSRIQAACPF